MMFVLGSLLVIAQAAAGMPPAAAPSPAATPSAIQPSGARSSAASPDERVEPARVEIVLFSDFQCPFCANFAAPFRDMQQATLDGVIVSVQFKNFPLPFHPRAQLAHQAALAAGAQGKFWEMHDLLFANQQRAQREDLFQYAKAIGLDMDRFAADLDSDAVRQAIEADKAEGTKRRVDGTPTFFINGRPYSGARTFPQLTQLVTSEQRRSRAMAEITDNLLSDGPAAAPVTLELFADLQSPVSGPTARVVEQVMKQYPSAVRLQFRNFPLSFHPQAQLAHEAAMTAAREGHFWEFVTYVLAHQDALREQDLIALAGRLGLDEVKFAATLQQHRYAPRIESDVEAGLRRGIRGSPVILVNDRRIDGVPSVEKLTAYIEAALAGGQAPAGGKDQP